MRSTHDLIGNRIADESTDKVHDKVLQRLFYKKIKNQWKYQKNDTYLHKDSILLIKLD